MSTPDQSPLFSVEVHAAHSLAISTFRRGLQAHHKRILGRLEAELRIRQLQEKLIAAEERALRPEKPVPQPSAVKWSHWLEPVKNSPEHPRAVVFTTEMARQEVELIKEQLARMTKVDNPNLLTHIEATAQAIEGDTGEIPEEANLTSSVGAIEEEDKTEAAPSAAKPSRKSKGTSSSNGAG